MSFDVNSVEEQDEISLRMHLSYLEVKFFPEVSVEDELVVPGPITAARWTSVAKICNSVRVTMENSLKRSLIKLHYDVKKVGPTVSLNCPFNTCNQLHPVKKGKYWNFMHCNSTSRKKKARLPAAGKCWYNECENIHHNYSYTQFK